NNGDGTFGPPQNYSTAFGYTLGVVIADFNGDGHPDVADTNVYGGTAGVLLNNGDGTLGAPTLYSLGAACFLIAAGDVNGDGVLDLATSNSDSGSASVLPGKGDGTFGSA